MSKVNEMMLQKDLSHLSLVVNNEIQGYQEEIVDGGQFENMIHYKQCRLIPYK